MNLLQIKQKMLEMAVSESYMADACGVGLHYFKQCTTGSKPMTKVLEQKINGVFKSLEIRKNKERMDKEKLKKEREYGVMKEIKQVQSDQSVKTMEITEDGCVFDNGENLIKAEKHFSVGPSVLVPMSELPSNPLLSGIVNTAREYINIFGNTIQDMEFELDNKEVHFVIEIKDKEV